MKNIEQITKELDYRYPTLWRDGEKIRQKRAELGIKWAPWCYLPVACWGALLKSSDPLQTAQDVAEAACIGAWRYTKGVYRFGAELSRDLRETDLDGEIPADVLLRLPQWCIYIEERLTCFDEEIQGFFAYLDDDPESGIKELRLALLSNTGIHTHIIALGEWNIEEGLKRVCDNGAEVAVKLGLAKSVEEFSDLNLADVKKQLTPLISMVLYLCSDEPEITNLADPEMRPSKANYTKSKKGAHLIPPPTPTIWEVGRETSRTLREGYERAGAQRRAHVRRAHWHGFWRGKRDSADRTFGYKWLPPIIVGA